MKKIIKAIIIYLVIRIFFYFTYFGSDYIDFFRNIEVINNTDQTIHIIAIKNDNEQDDIKLLPNDSFTIIVKSDNYTDFILQDLSYLDYYKNKFDKLFELEEITDGNKILRVEELDGFIKTHYLPLYNQEVSYGYNCKIIVNGE